MKLWLDLETFCEVSIRAGTHAYAEKAEVMLFAYGINNGPATVWDVTLTGPDNPPADLLEAIYTPEVEVWAHNTHFDRTVLSHAMPDLCPPLECWRDTMIQATSHSLPGALGDLSIVLGMPSDKAKDKDGKRLIQMFCQPTPANYKTRRYTRDTHPEDWARFVEYARLDIEAMREVHRKVPRWNYPNTTELALWHIDQRINDRGVQVDMALVTSALEAVAEAQKDLAKSTSEATLGLVESASKRDALLRHLGEVYGFHLDDLQGSTLERKLEDPTLDPGVRELLRLRLQTSTTSTAKYKALQKATSRDMRVRGLLQFNGASRTGRWAGRVFQPQNLPRPSLKDKAIEQGIQDLKDGGANLIHSTEYIMQLASSAIRGCLVAAPGKKLCIADLSNIEGRALAWLAGEQWKLDAFAEFDAGTGHDLYALAYAKSFGVTPEEVMHNKKHGDGNMRQIGKVQELALGYEGGVGAFVTFADGYGIDLDALAPSVLAAADPEIEKEARQMFAWFSQKGKDTYGLREDTFVACDIIKRGWRNAHPNITLWWGELDTAFRDAIAHPGKEFTARTVVIDRPMTKAGKPMAWVRIKLPSGRYLCYPSPKIEYRKTTCSVCHGAGCHFCKHTGKEDDPTDKTGTISYRGLNQYSRKWGTLKTYSGKLAENVTQAFARDVLAYNMPAIERDGYEIVLSVHDELLTETPDTDEYSSDALSAHMSTVPPWAEGLPLAAAGFETHRYKKD